MPARLLGGDLRLVASPDRKAAGSRKQRVILAYKETILAKKQRDLRGGNGNVEIERHSLAALPALRFLRL